MLCSSIIYATQIQLCESKSKIDMEAVDELKN